MGEKKTNAIKRVKELEKKIRVVNIDTIIEPTEHLEGYKANYVVDRFINYSVSKAIDAVGYDNLLTNYNIFDLNEEQISKVFINAASNINSNKLKNPEITAMLESEASAKDKAAFCKNFFMNTPDAAEYRSLVTKELHKALNIDKIDKLDKLIDKVAEKYELDVDDFIADDEIFNNPMDNGANDEVKLKSEQIADLKAASLNDPEFINILDKADKFCVMGNENTVAFGHGIAEDLGQDSLKLELKSALDYIKESPEYDINQFDPGARSVVYSALSTRKEIAETTKKAIDSYPKPSQAIQKKIVAIDKFIRDHGFTEDFDKVGTLKPLSEAKKKLMEAIDSKDKRAIIEATNKYENMYGFYRELLQMCNDLTTENKFPNNVSLARNAGIPFEFRNDIKGTSILRGLTTTLHACNQNGITAKQYFADPVRSTAKILDNITKNSIVDATFKNKNIIESINALYASSPHVTTQEMGSTTDLDSGFVLLSSLATGPKAGEIRAKGVMVHRGVIDKQSIVSLDGFYSDPASLANFIAAEDEDRNPRDVSNYTIRYDENFNFKKFDIKDYVLSGKSAVGSILSRIIQINDAVKSKAFNKNVEINNIKIAVKDNIDALKDNEIALSETDRKVINNIEANRYDKITETDKMVLNNEAAINKIINSNNLNGNVNNSINKIAEIKREYNSRNFLYKLFGSETRRLNRTVNALTDKLVANGIDRNIINQKMTLALNNELDADLPVEEPVHNDLDVPNLDEPIDLDESVVSESSIINNRKQISVDLGEHKNADFEIDSEIEDLDNVNNLSI